MERDNLRYPGAIRVNRKCHAIRATPTPCFSQSAGADVGRTLFVSGGEGDDLVLPPPDAVGTDQPIE